jgi:FAD/FMN-containing dehydrogenase
MMKAYLDALTAELGGEVTFHWGQMLNGLEPSHVAASYPEYPAWKAIRDGLDPDGRFLNSWQRSILPE